METTTENATQALLKLVRDNPEMPVVPMVNYELVADDCSYWQGSFGKAELTEIYTDPDKEMGVYIKGWNDDELYEEIYEQLCFDRSEEENDTLTAKQKEQQAKTEFDAIPWKKVIAVYIELPD
ncbi:hypothetical protein [Sporolactobacillus terrae]|uniref:Uncharacterized protein n=1 Tax=Sporolactobacillus terrae TaxID=269673 RepID=A0A5K7X3G1_9BACL|nr:hypothetical protein [Sporolactobacillus terrae]BBN99183.1 hypothetical protein St703_18880 [Sporolactobacillus terrae]